MIRRRRHDDVEAGLYDDPTTTPRTLSLQELAPRATESSKYNWAGHKCESLSCSFRRLVTMLVVGILLLVGLHELYFFVVLNRISVHKRTRYTRPPVTLDKARFAVVSLHRGLKFSGYLGKWLSDNKALYARRHGYAYADEALFPPESKLAHLDKWQAEYRRRIKFDKLRFLLYLMETFSNLDYLLWMDADAVITQPNVRLQDRIRQFQSLYRKKQSKTDLCFVWAADDKPNTGIMLLKNTPMTRALVKKSLTTFSEQQIYMDQASFAQTVKTNSTFTDCHLLLTEKRATLLQSRVRGPIIKQYKPGDWIMHLPNHNRLEMIQSLSFKLSKTGETPTPCQPLAPLGPPDLTSLSNERRVRYEAVRDAVRFAWDAYASVTIRNPPQQAGVFSLENRIPFDDLSPLSSRGSSWLYYAATLHDSLDTLYIANLTREYNEAVTFVTSYDIQTTSLRPTKTFEYSLRVLGGLLGAYSVSGDVRLLTAAQTAADAMLEGPFRASPTVLPRMYNVLAPTSSCWKASLHRLYARLYEWARDAFTKEHHINSLAGVGSFGLEFSFLSRVTRDWTYRDASDAIFDMVTTTSDKSAQQRIDTGVVPTLWNVMTGTPLNRGGPIGSGADSFYEYLLKIPLLNGCGKLGGDKTNCLSSDRNMLSLHHKMVNSTLRANHVRETTDVTLPDHHVSYPVDGGNSFHHLLCFVPGMLALGQVEIGSDENTKDMGLARDLLMGCHDTYESSPTGLGPEQALIRRHGEETDNGSNVVASNPSYLLRPEYVESLFVLYRLSKDEKYQTMAWEVFQSLNHYCKTEFGYAGLRNVNDPSEGHVDDMPSYFIAETLKYLLLLFGPDDYMPLDDYVFTTEAHPMRRIKEDDIVLCNIDDAGQKNIPVAVPWLLVACTIGILVLVMAVTYLCSRAVAHWRKKGKKKRKDI